MAFCEQCGTPLGTGAGFCGDCGKPAGTPATMPLARPEGTFKQASVPPAAGPAYLAGLLEKWRRRFSVIEQAGGERVRWWKLPEARRLT